MAYLVLDARYEKVRHAGSVVSCAVLIAVGITPQGHRSLLGASVSLSGAEVHWREFLASLHDRNRIASCIWLDALSLCLVRCIRGYSLEA